MFNSVASIALAFATANLGSGSALAGFCFWSDSTKTITGVTDSAGNTWTLVPETLQSAGGQSIQWFYTENAAGSGTKPTVTVTFSAAVSSKCLAIYELSGTPSSSALDGKVGASIGDVGAGTNAISSGTWATLANGDLLLAGMMSGGYSGSTITAGTATEAFTVDQSLNANNQCFTTEHASQAAASASTEATFTPGGFTGSIIISALAFKPGGASPSSFVTNRQAIPVPGPRRTQIISL